MAFNPIPAVEIGIVKYCPTCLDMKQGITNGYNTKGEPLWECDTCHVKISDFQEKVAYAPIEIANLRRALKSIQRNIQGVQDRQDMIQLDLCTKLAEQLEEYLLQTKFPSSGPDQYCFAKGPNFDQSLTASGNLTNWTVCKLNTSAVRLDEVTLECDGDQTAICVSGSIVVSSVGGVKAYSTVSSSTYDGGAGKTTVNLLPGYVTGGTLWAWGKNSDGQLGDSTLVDKVSPIQIGALNNWSALAGGLNFTLALKSDNNFWTWGNNSTCQLGSRRTWPRSSPVQVGHPNSLVGLWTQVAGGNDFASGIKSSGTLWTWGNNTYGQLGDATIELTNSPAEVLVLELTTVPSWNQVSCGDSFTAATKSDGTLWTWGKNDNGQLGDNTTINKSEPIQVGIFQTITPPPDTLYWYNAFDPEDEHWYDSLIPEVPITQDVWSKVSCGSDFAVAVKKDGTLWNWGHGALSYPVQIGSETTWSKIVCGNVLATAIKTTPAPPDPDQITLWSWSYGNAPAQIGSDTDWGNAVVDCKDGHVNAIKSDTTLWIDGAQVGSTTGWSKVACGISHAVAIGAGYISADLAVGADIWIPHYIFSAGDDSIIDEFKKNWDFAHDQIIRALGITGTYGTQDTIEKNEYGCTIYVKSVAKAVKLVSLMAQIGS
jgi:alpha-tubulin suppressor-like RCC1 family protein